VGLDRSARVGDGSEFAGIRAFQHGDRLRRIHWPRSLRTGELHVTTTWSDQDRHVVLLVDAFSDVGTSEGIDGRASSLDTTVRAAGAIAEHHLHRGDRVALQIIGSRGVSRVPPATGSAQLRRILDRLTAIEAGTVAIDDPGGHLSMPAGVLVVMLSPLVSPKALERASAMARRGLSVAVVDTLPPDIVDDDDRVLRTVPRRVMRAERLMHRAVFVAVEHPDGQLLVHRRSEAKDLWPGWWDLAVGGVVGAGETYDDAACRELAEEVGIVGIEPQPLGGGRYVDDAVALIGRCYRVVHAGPFAFADGEVVEARWLSRPELGAALATTRFLPDSLALLLPLL
jgi:8-oxo-dGTP pyrophosphatase MutT (NUDIX family)